jgi:hypothetical protein
MDPACQDIFSFDFFLCLALPLSHFYLFIIISLFALILGQQAKKGY